MARVIFLTASAVMAKIRAQLKIDSLVTGVYSVSGSSVGVPGKAWLA